jgi:DNA-binding NtrC family response regulator/tetratricopeptide (TPR) repeat protein
MASLNSTQVSQYVRRGLFLDALKELREKPLTSSDAALAAQVLVSVGRIRGAVEHATRILGDELASSNDRSQAQMVLGRASFVSGDWKAALDRVRLSIRAAEQAEDPAQLCRALLCLLSMSCDAQTARQVDALVRQIKSLAIQTGDSQILAELHRCLARIEGTRGSLKTAGYHVEAGFRLLDVEDNTWLRATLSNAACILEVFRDELEQALELARSAERFSELSGHLGTHQDSLANLVQLHLWLGDPHRAQSYLQKALKLDAGHTPSEVALLDSQATLAIERGNLTDGLRMLRELRGVTSTRGLQSTWADLTVIHTTVQALLTNGDFGEALDEAERGLSVASEARNPVFETKLRLLKAEALRRLARPLEAADSFCAALETSPSSSVSMVADQTHLELWLLADLGQPVLASRQFDRLQRIRQSIKFLPSSFSLAKEWESVKAGQDPACHPPSDDALRGITALLDLSANPELIGREAFALLQSTGACTGLALVARRPRRGPEIVAAYGWDNVRAAAAVRASGPHAVISLGQRGDRTFDLVVEPAGDLLSRCTVVAIRKVIGAALSLEAYRRDERQRASLWPAGELEPGGQDIVASAPMIETLATARKVAPLPIPVLITGETGTGKEVLARAIHRASPRSSRPFLPFNCTAIPRDMIESQLFGYRRGAFTGAHEGFPGVIRAAAGGTLFLDEIGDLPADVQPKLLRFLDTNEIHPLGEPQPIHVDVRVIAATNANLGQMVGQGRFREDLFYRLNVIPFQLPPLRERREEIPPLARHFLRRSAEEFRKGRLRLSDETMEYLLLHSWPGNVRQLANEIRRMAALAEPDSTLEPAALSAEVQASRRTGRGEAPASVDEITVRVDQPLPDALATIERLMVRRALERADGRFEEAARLLGISRKGLFLKRRRWGVQTRAS